MKIYFIGICGIAMGSIAIALKKHGDTVYGSDKSFYPPMSDQLREANIEILVGYKEGRIKEINPEIVVIGNAIPLDNPEYLEAKKLGLNIVSYPEILNKFAVKNNSVVITGTYGKTTTSAFIVYLLKELGINPSYMVGGKALNLANMVEFNNSDISIIEGDEYYTSKLDLKSKFFHYNTKYLVLTSCEWDHTDIFKTEEEYINNFVRLVKSIPQDGKIIANKKGKNVQKVISLAGQELKTVYYEYTEEYFKLITKNTLPFVIGKHNYENMIAGYTLINCLIENNVININKDKFNDVFIKSISNFKGIERRLNLILKTDRVVIIDDFAHSPSKFKATIQAVKENFNNNFEIYAIIEPNLGNRTLISLNSYSNVFNLVKGVFIPKWRISKLKEDSSLASQEQLAEVIKKENINSEVILSDDVLLNRLIDISKDKNIIFLFMGTESFRGLPQELAKKLNE